MKKLQSTSKIANDPNSKFVLGLAEKKDIKALQKLRYDELILDYDSSKEANGLDASEYDDFCDHLIVKEIDTNKIVGTYRLMTNKHLKHKNEFICESEFNISKLKQCPENILELGRAVVHKGYRQGTVLKLLWSGILDYSKMNNVRYLFGTASFHGVNTDDYKNAFSKVYYSNLVDENIMCEAKEPNAPLCVLKPEEIDPIKAKSEMPSLIKGYLAMGCKVGKGAFIDYDFNSTDIMVILDLQNINETYFNRMFSV